MEVSFGAYAMCPPKNLIRKIDSPEAKRMIAENIRAVKKLVQEKDLQPYVNGDTFIFSRKGRGKFTQFFLEVKSNSGDSKPWALFGRRGNLQNIGKRGFIDAIMTHLCIKENVDIRNDSWTKAFRKYIKKQETQTQAKKVITESPKKYELLCVPQPEQKKLPKPETIEERIERINNMTVVEAEYELYGTSIFGHSDITWGKFLEQFAEENAESAASGKAKPKRTRRTKKSQKA